MSASRSLNRGLLFGFDNVMAGLSAQDVEDVEDVERASQSEHEPSDSVAETGSARDSARDSARGSDSPPAVMSATEPRSIALARRILGLDAEVLTTGRTPLRCVSMTGGAEIELDDWLSGALFIGRADRGVGEPDRQLIVDRAQVSRRHCQVIVTPGGFGLIDLGSVNATRVLRHGSIHRVVASPLLLQAGDLISTLHGECPMVQVEAARS